MVTGPAAPRVSVLLPTHNRADVLAVAIRSVLAQTETDFELLVVGNGCTDHSGDVVRGFADHRIRWLNLPKARGFGYANRNVGLRQARGEIVAYMAHDDLWFPDHLELLLGCLETTGAEFAYTRTLHVSAEGHISAVAFNLEDPRTRSQWLTTNIGYLSLASVAHRTECLTRYGYWNENMDRGGDWELWRRIIEGGKRRNMCHEPTPTCFHFVAAWRVENAQSRWWRRLQHHAHGLAELTVATPPGMTQQEAVWRALMADPPRSFRCVRSAAQIELDRGANVEYPLLSLIHWMNRLRRRLITR